MNKRMTCALVLAVLLLVSLIPTYASAQDAEPVKVVFAQVDDGFSEVIKSEESKAVHQAIIDAIGVDLQPVYYPSDQYWNRVNMTLASGDQMDIFCRASLQQGIQFLNDGVVLDMTDVIAEKIPNYLAACEQYEGFALARSEAQSNGKDLGFPMVSTLVRPSTLQIRTDWLEALNMDVPATVEEFVAYMESVKTMDPDGNGQDDTYGLCGSVWGGDVIAILATAYLPSGNNFWLDEDGLLQHPGLHPNYKTLLSDVISWIEEGYLPPEALLSSDDQRLDWFVNNQLGAVAGWYSAPIGGRVTLVEKVPDAWYEPINLVGLDGAANASQNQSAFTSLNLVTANTEVLDAVAAYYDFMYSEEGWILMSRGIEGLTYELIDGQPSQIQNENGQNRYYSCYVPQLENNLLTDWGFFAGPAYNLTLYRGLVAATDALPGFNTPDKGVAYDNTVMASFDVQADINTYFNEQRAKVLAGETPVEEWDNIMQNWLDMGGGQYTADMNEQYKAAQAG